MPWRTGRVWWGLGGGHAKVLRSLLVPRGLVTRRCSEASWTEEASELLQRVPEGRLGPGPFLSRRTAGLSTASPQSPLAGDFPPQAATASLSTASLPQKPGKPHASACLQPLCPYAVPTKSESAGGPGTDSDVSLGQAPTARPRCSHWRPAGRAAGTWESRARNRGMACARADIIGARMCTCTHRCIQVHMRTQLNPT